MQNITKHAKSASDNIYRNRCGEGSLISVFSGLEVSNCAVFDEAGNENVGSKFIPLFCYSARGNATSARPGHDDSPRPNLSIGIVNEHQDWNDRSCGSRAIGLANKNQDDEQQAL